MRTEIRIVAGALRGRKVLCRVCPELRPTPQMVREAFFSILGNAIPNRRFFDVFAGTGVVGIEALSRGASGTSFVEREVGLANSIQDHLKKFSIAERAKIFRTDSYRWMAAWQPPAEPVNVFVSPPFPDLEQRPELLVGALARLQTVVAPESVIVVQSERDCPFDLAPEMQTWERRTYGRNVLLIWQRDTPEPPQVAPAEASAEAGADAPP